MMNKICCALFGLLFSSTVLAGTLSITGPSSYSPKTQKASTPSVELYATSWCGYCQKARLFFRKKGIKFIEYDIEKDKKAAYRKQQLDSGRGVPFAVINGQKISGYSEALYIRALRLTP